MENTHPKATHALKLQVIQAFSKAVVGSLDAVLATEKILKEGSETDQEVSADSLMTKREEMMDEVALHDEIAADAKDHQLALAALDASHSSHQVELGALVFTNLHAFLVCAPLRPVYVDGYSFVGASVQSPLVQALIGKKVGDSAVVDGKTITISQIV
jgi:hypothetical protein